MTFLSTFRRLRHGPMTEFYGTFRFLKFAWQTLQSVKLLSQRYMYAYPCDGVFQGRFSKEMFTIKLFIQPSY